MSVQKNPAGRRSVKVEVEVPGTPEQVWEAIATGPGVSSWFIPTRVENGSNGVPARMVLSFGPGMDSIATVTAWDPPRRFAATSDDWGPGAPSVATEWIVEARSGGVCVVRVVHSLFASTDDWDNQLESTESGWPTFFRILRLYLTYFRGQRSAVIQVMGVSTDSEPKAWDALTRPLGLAGATKGTRWKAPAGAPPLAGVVEYVGEGKHPHNLLLRVDQPSPGIASLGVFACGGPVQGMLSFYLYGERAEAIAADNQPAWQAWMNERFPMPTAPSGGT